MVRLPENMHDKCPTCDGLKGYKARQCSTCYHKTGNRLPDYKKGGRPGMYRPPCPKCGGVKRTYQAKQCLTCHNKEHNRSGWQRLSRDPYEIHPDDGIIRPVNQRQELNPMVRPSHYPPPCEGCRGFGYLRMMEGWVSCQHCYAHPGHACSWEEHRARVA